MLVRQVAHKRYHGIFHVASYFIFQSSADLGRELSRPGLHFWVGIKRSLGKHRANLSQLLEELIIVTFKTDAQQLNQLNSNLLSLI
jgi:hypothetical protein